MYNPFDTPQQAHIERREPSSKRSSAEQRVSRSSREDLCPSFRSRIREFLRDVVRCHPEDAHVNYLLDFIVANGTIYTDDDHEFEFDRKLEGPVDIEAINDLLRGNSAKSLPIFVDNTSRLFGIIHNRGFFPLTGLFAKPKFVHPGVVKYRRVLWAKIDVDHTDALDQEFDEHFSSTPMTSSKQCSDDTRGYIYVRTRIILNQDWTILEKWIKPDDGESTTYIQIPILLSASGQRFNWKYEASRLLLTEHLKQTYEDITLPVRRSCMTYRCTATIMSWWKMGCLKRLSKTYKVGLSDNTLCPVIYALLMDIPIPMNDILKDAVFQFRYTGKSRTSHSEYMTSNVSLLNDFCSDDETFKRKPLFDLNLDTDRNKDADAGSGKYHDIMSEKTEEVRKWLSELNVDIYDASVIRDEAGNLIEALFATPERWLDVIKDTECITASEDTIFRLLWCNLDYYMRILPNAAECVLDKAPELLEAASDFQTFTRNMHRFIISDHFGFHNKGYCETPELECVILNRTDFPIKVDLVARIK